MHRAGAALLFFFAAAVCLVQPASSEPTKFEILAKARMMLEDRSYDCTMRIARPHAQRGPKEIYHRIIHIPGKTLIHPLLRDANGELSEVEIYFIQDDRGRFLIDNRRKIAVADPRSWSDIRGWLSTGVPDSLSEISSQYSSENVSSDKIGSTDAWLVTVGGRLEKSLWVSKDTGFPLKLDISARDEVLITFEIMDITFIEPSAIDQSEFEIPAGYALSTATPNWGFAGAVPPNAWLPLVPDMKKVPIGYSFEQIIPHVFKKNLVYQVVFAGNDSSDTVSVFETKNHELAKMLAHKTETGPLHFVIHEVDEVLLVALGELDPEVLESFTEIFYRNDDLARDLATGDKNKWQ